MVMTDLNQLRAGDLALLPLQASKQASMRESKAFPTPRRRRRRRLRVAALMEWEKRLEGQMPYFTKQVLKFRRRPRPR